MKKFLFVILAMACCSVSFAETGSGASVSNQAKSAPTQKNAPQGARPSALATSTCSFTFTSGSGPTFLKYCVTANGNITQFETPEFHEHIAVGELIEGYGICDVTASEVNYFDFADEGDSRNWGPATVASQTAKSVKIVRSTGDGNWTLTQTFTQMAGASPSVQVAMKLNNNTAVDRTAVLLRAADADVSGLFNNDFDATLNSAFAWNLVGASEPGGLVLQAVGTPPSPLRFGIVLNVPDAPLPCTALDQATPGPLTAIDGSIGMIFGVIVPKNSSRTVTVAYKGF